MKVFKGQASKASLQISTQKFSRCYFHFCLYVKYVGIHHTGFFVLPRSCIVKRHQVNSPQEENRRALCRGDPRGRHPQEF